MLHILRGVQQPSILNLFVIYGVSTVLFHNSQATTENCQATGGLPRSFALARKTPWVALMVLVKLAMGLSLGPSIETARYSRPVLYPASWRMPRIPHAGCARFSYDIEEIVEVA
jgi:hypothetical protein